MYKTQALQRVLWGSHIKPRFECTQRYGINRKDPLARDLIGCWLFNEGAGDTVVDLSGYGNHGTLTNMNPATDWLAGQDGSIIDFDGSDDRIFIGNTPSMGVTGDLTIEAIVSIDVNAQMIFVAKDKNTGGRAYTLDYHNTSNLRFYVNGGASGDIITGNTAFTVGKWYQAVGVYNTAGTLDLYVNGVKDATQVGSVVTSIPTATANTLFGRREYAGAEGPYDGKMNSVMMWKRSLSEEEIWRRFVDPYGMFVPEFNPIVFGEVGVTGQPTMRRWGGIPGMNTFGNQGGWG